MRKAADPGGQAVRGFSGTARTFTYDRIQLDLTAGIKFRGPVAALWIGFIRLCCYHWFETGILEDFVPLRRGLGYV